MKIGIAMPVKGMAEVGECARVVSEYEFGSFSMYGDLGDLPPYAGLHSIASVVRGTKLGSIGPMAVPVALMHPDVIASHALALEQQAPGQTHVGLVRGAFHEKIGLRPGTLSDISYAVSRLEDNFEKDGVEIPIYIGGFGPRILKQAKDLGVCGVKIGGSANAELAKAVRNQLGDGQRLVMGSVSVMNRDRRLARELARIEVAKYLNVVGFLDQTLDPYMIDNLTQFAFRYQIGDSLAHKYISDELLDKFAVAGTPEDVIERLDELDGLVDLFELGTPHGLGMRGEAIRLIGDTVLKDFEGNNEI